MRNRHVRVSGKISQCGQAVVELAVILPVLLLLLLGMTEFARMTGDFLTMQHAVREGLRSGMTGAPDADIDTRVRLMATGMTAERLTITVIPVGAVRTTGVDLTVRATYRFAVLTPLLSQVMGGEVVLSSQLVGRVE